MDGLNYVYHENIIVSYIIIIKYRVVKKSRNPYRNEI
jgi:hypothetical protein